MRRILVSLTMIVCVCVGFSATSGMGMTDAAMASAQAQTVMSDCVRWDCGANVDGFPQPFVPPGACELPNGDCVVTLDTICRFLGGEFQGANTTCD